MTTLPLSLQFDPAVKHALVLQSIATVLLMLVLDGGSLAKVGSASMVAFWIGAAVVMARRPRTPTGLDLLYIRWGFLPVLLVGMRCIPFMGALRG
jgi:hypothetical protein